MAAPDRRHADITAQSSINHVQLSQNYTLPKVVKTALEATIQQANALAIVMALFAGALVSFAQIVSGVDPSSTDTNSISWGALLVFLYAAIILSLGGSFLSLIVIKMCSDLPLAAQKRVLGERLATRKTLSNVAAGGLLSEYVLANHFVLLETFGMSTSYKHVVRMSDLVLIFACVSTFAALTFWVFVSEALITAGVTMIFFGATGLIVIIAYVIAGHGQRWA